MKSIEPKQVKLNEYQLIDVRTPGEFASGHIGGSVNIPLDDIAHEEKILLGFKKPLLIICKSGMRSGKACTKLDELNLDAAVLKGGLNAWASCGYDIVQGAVCDRWDLERQVRFVAGLLVLSGVVFGFFVSQWFYLLSGFVGAGLMFASITNTCGMGMLLAKLPYNRK